MPIVDRGSEIDCLGIPIRSAVYCGFCHFFVHGIFVTAFVFSNNCYPPLYYVDYLFGGSGAVLIPVSAIGFFIAYLKKWQPLRSFWAFITVLNILTVSAGSFYYTTERWHDVETTALSQLFRKAGDKDFHDRLWYSLSISSCFLTIVFLVYCGYIIYFMCREANLNLISGNPAQPVAAITVPAIRPKVQYPTQDV